MTAPPATSKVITGYYGATIVFLLLDYLLDFNVRLIFLDDWPDWRALYYGICFGFFGLMLWRPRWSRTVGAAESLFNLAALIISMALRVMIASDEMIEEGRGFVTVEQSLNFVIVGMVSYFSLLRGVLAGRREFP